MVATAIALDREEEVLTGVIAERVLAAPAVPVVFSHPVDLLSRSSPAVKLSLF